jgi:hypothetical protein
MYSIILSSLKLASRHKEFWMYPLIFILHTFLCVVLAYSSTYFIYIGVLIYISSITDTWKVKYNIYLDYQHLLISHYSNSMKIFILIAVELVSLKLILALMTIFTTMVFTNLNIIAVLIIFIFYYLNYCLIISYLSHLARRYKIVNRILPFILVIFSMSFIIMNSRENEKIISISVNHFVATNIFNSLYILYAMLFTLMNFSITFYILSINICDFKFIDKKLLHEKYWSI